MKNYFHPHYIHILTDMVRHFCWCIINRLSAAYWRVNLGTGARFMGKTVWRILPDSFMVFGSNCSFNSSPASNLIGVNTPCIFSISKRGAIIKVGNNCGFSGTVIRSAVAITLGNDVRCGANTLIYDNDGHAGDPRSGKDAPVVIKNNVWLGYGVKVLKGVTIGENSLIGACSVVTKDIPANVIAAGNPCRVIRKMEIK